MANTAARSVLQAATYGGLHIGDEVSLATTGVHFWGHTSIGKPIY